MAGLQSAFHVVKPVPNAEAAAPTVKVNYCSVHTYKESMLYCETCGELICWKCVSKGGLHHDHDYKELDRAFEKYKDEITSSLEPMEKQVTTMMGALAQLDSFFKEIPSQQAATESNIRVTFDRLQEILNMRKAGLISQLNEATKNKLKDLATQRDQIETRLAQLNGCLYFMRKSISSSNEGDVLKMKRSTENKIKNLTTPFELDILKPNTHIIFSASSDMPASCQNYGWVSTDPGLPDPSKCQLTCKDAETAVIVGNKSTAILHANSFESEPCEIPIRSLECKILSEIAGTSVSCSVERKGQSQYEISCQPTIKGRHQLHVKVEGHHVRGSPINVSVKSPVEQLGAPLQSIERVRRPRGVAINQRGEVVVTEVDGCCVSVFSPNGERLQSFGAYGFDREEFFQPCGVTVDGEGNILVADSGNHRIQKFTAEGQFLAAVGTKGSGQLEFSNPTGIAISKNMIYVAEWNNHRVQVLNSDLTFSSTFGRKGSGKGELNSPWGIAFDSAGKVYVADGINCRIQVFTAEGKFLRTFGKHGQGRGELDYPVGIAIDNNGMVYVSEYINRRISVFTTGGQFVTSFRKEGDEPGDQSSSFLLD